MGQIRIIGGKWRGRKIAVLDDVAGLRPTPNMARETLFNWLAPVIDGAVCLDLFAGSGALSFEALSRGAGRVVAVDSARKVIKRLQENAALLLAPPVARTRVSEAGVHEESNALTIFFAIIPGQLRIIPKLEFNIVFLDPPFNHNLVVPTLSGLEEAKLLVSDALVYIEVERQFDIDAALVKLSGWEVLRRKTLGAVGYYLVKKVVPINSEKTSKMENFDQSATKIFLGKNAKKWFRAKT